MTNNALMAKEKERLGIFKASREIFNIITNPNAQIEERVLLCLVWWVYIPIVAMWGYEWVEYE